MTSHPTLEKTSWTSTPERGSLPMLRIMAWCSLKFGRNATRIALYPITAYFLLFSPKSRSASRAYLERALEREVCWQDMYRHFLFFASTIHDRIYFLNGLFDLFDFEIHGEHLLEKDSGLFLIGAHLGSFEAISAVGKKNAGLSVAMLMHEANARKINRVLTAINPQSEQEIIGLGNLDAMLKVEARLNEGYAVGMLADRTPGNEACCPVQILGETAHLPTGPFRMAALLKRPVVFMTGLYLGGNRYAIHFDELADFSAAMPRDQAIQAAVNRYAELLDQYCRKAPRNWFNFFDFWKAGDR